ncbi:hypothetical protein RvY_12410 [Ramazzottius varieornatus]|uniref:CUB domain-containing protein n=1 Tax=Ramazzottius varieornatus TaxID=947166 RepID=A0A1D1VLF6_RAMVA|nr:hypothetical protein RvY_12410 [Ramazzottius varieornatus]
MARALVFLLAEWVVRVAFCAPMVKRQTGPMMVNSDGSVGMATGVNGSIDGSVSRLSGTWNLPSWNGTEGMTWAMALASDMSSSAMMVTASPQQISAGIRMEIQLVRFENPGSLIYDGQFCDTTSKCDPRFFVDLDVNTAYAAWPGPRSVHTFQHIIDRTNQDVFDLGEGVSKDICGNVTAANLRVEVVDMEDVSEPDLMNDFDCIFTLDVVGATAQNTPWSAIQQCRAYYNVDSVKLYFRHREYALPSDAVLQTC